MKKQIYTFLAGAMLASLGSIVVAGNASATTYDLNDYGVSYQIGATGAIATEFTIAMQQSISSGTGVITPFLTINAKGAESGVNTDGTPLPFDDQRPEWNSAITLRNLQDSGYRFALDINEPDAGVKPVLSLDEFKVWVLPSVAGGSLVNKNNVKVGNTDTYNALATLLSANGGTQAFDLGDNNILLHYDLWNGSGQNLDMLLEVPTTNFSTFGSDDYLYVWAKFSGSDMGGFEEWILIPADSPPVPEPGTIMLLGVGLFGLCVFGKRRINSK